MSHMLLSGVWNGEMLCFHCGERHPTILPDDTSNVIVKLEAFKAKHQSCVKTPKGVLLSRAHRKAHAELIVKVNKEQAEAKKIIDEEIDDDDDST